LRLRPGPRWDSLAVFDGPPCGRRKRERRDEGKASDVSVSQCQSEIFNVHAKMATAISKSKRREGKKHLLLAATEKAKSRINS